MKIDTFTEVRKAQKEIEVLQKRITLLKELNRTLGVQEELMVIEDTDTNGFKPRSKILYNHTPKGKFVNMTNKAAIHAFVRERNGLATIQEIISVVFNRRPNTNAGASCRSSISGTVSIDPNIETRRTNGNVTYHVIGKPSRGVKSVGTVKSLPVPDQPAL